MRAWSRRPVVFAAGLLLRTSSAFADPEAVTRVPPEFPAQASAENIQGMVRLGGDVSANGTISNFHVQSEEPAAYGFGDAAKAALAQWKFKPGQPGAFVTAMNFGLDGTLSLKDYYTLPEAPARVDTVGPLFQSPYTAKAGVSGVVDMAFDVDNIGVPHRLQTVNVVPGGYDFEAAAVSNIVLWQFPQGHPGRYRTRLTFNAATKVYDFYADTPKLNLPKGFKLDYPERALASSIQGEAKVLVTIDETGEIEKVGLISETPPGYGFGQAAERALLHLIYDHTTRPGCYQLRVRFLIGG